MLAGQDTFVFGTNFGDDAINDFQHGLDQIDFRGDGFTSEQVVISSFNNFTLSDPDARGNDPTLRRSAQSN